MLPRASWLVLVPPWTLIWFRPFAVDLVVPTLFPAQENRSFERVLLTICDAGL
jgi:hypothetical protein